MKILLLGEYSSLHNNLAHGLKILGHDVFLANDGDLFKNFYKDINLKPEGKNKYSINLNRIILENRFIKNMDYFDVIQIINPSVFSTFHISNPYKSILRKGRKTFLLAAGDDYFYWKAYRDGKYRYSPHKGTLEIDSSNFQSIHEKGKLRFYNEYLSENVDGIISCSVLYKIAYQEHSNYLCNIPFPINVEELNLRNENINSKLHFLHGQQHGRAGFKGSNYINKAINYLSIKYSDVVEFITTENIPYKEYIKLINNVDCIYDQTNSFDPGINALSNMAIGKIVFGGCEHEFMDEMRIIKPPLINIISNVDQIIEATENIILNRELIEIYSKNAIEYVVNNHDSILIAKKYLEIWK